MLNTSQEDQAKDLLKKYPIDYAIFFGSYLKKPMPSSDVDILVSGIADFEQSLDLALGLESIFKRKVDIVLLEKSSSAVVMEAICRGKPLLIKNRLKLKHDYFRNYYLFEDYRYLLETKIQGIKRRYSVE